MPFCVRTHFWERKCRNGYDFLISVKNCHANWSKMAYQYGYINIKNLDNTYIISNFALMKNFAAIDFETANQQRTSVCSVGIVIVRNGEIVDSYYSLIKPEPEYYSYWNTRVHGLTMEDTMNARVFPEVWAEIQPKIEGLPLVAHNSPFDEGCLTSVFQMYQMDYPDYEFHCTCRASRRKLGSLLPNHQLQTVAAYCGYDLTQHHNALADAEACAWIARELL